MAHPSHFRVKILKRDARRLTKAVVHLVFSLHFFLRPAGADLLGGGSRSETENKGLAGNRARTFSDVWPARADLLGGGSRS